MLSLVLAARSRALTLARLSTMGLGTGQGRLLVIAEALPPVLAAAVAGAACALALVPLLGPVLDLSVFTGSAAAVPVRADLVGAGDPGGRPDQSWPWRRYRRRPSRRAAAAPPAPFGSAAEGRGGR